MHRRWATVAWAALAVGCGQNAPVPVLHSVAPTTAYTEGPLRVTLYGGGFIPSYDLDLDDGRRRGSTAGFSGRIGSPASGWRPLRDFGWRSPDELSATLDAGLLPGTHTVEVVDPRGRTATLEAGFVALGEDRAAPTLAFLTPGRTTPLAGGMMVAVRFTAVEAAPGRLGEVTWEARVRGVLIGSGNCPVERDPGSTTCAATVTLPASATAGDELQLTAAATDLAARPNRGEAVLIVPLRDRPAVAAITPVRGSTSGGNDVLIRGSGFLPGTRVFFGGHLLVPAGGLLVDDTTISGRVPPNAPGGVPVRIATPIGDVIVDDGFRYAPPPTAERITPAEAPVAGGTLVRVRGQNLTLQTRVYLGSSLADGAPLVDAQLVDGQEIVGVVPPGRGRASVYVVDPELGWSRLADAFTWVDL